MAVAAAEPRPLNTLDLLKTLAVTLMITDHVGLYFLTDESWLRILGRGAAVIFGFLIGFSASTRVPPSWVGLGLGLTLLNAWLFPNDDLHTLDILISLALTRVVMPFFERVYSVSPLLLVPSAVALALVAQPLNAHLEYGTEVTLLALLGLAVRLDTGERSARAGRDAVALTAIVAMSLIAMRHFKFEGWEQIACVLVFAATILGLARFELSAVRLPAWLAPTLRFCGRNTLWIYAIHLAAFQIIAWWIAAPLDE